MKRKLAGALICVLLLPGCNNDVEKPEPQRHVVVDTPRGKVMIQDPRSNPDEGYFTGSVLGEGIDATLRLEPTGDGIETAGMSAELRDHSGRLLFSLEMTANQTTGEIVYTQATPEDYLTLGIIADDERVRERYDANGDVATFEYAALSDDTQRRALNYYHHGLSTAHLPPDISHYVSRLGAFDAYYRPHATSTLHDNPYGELLVQILSTPELADVVTGDIPDPERWRWLEQTCATARTCATLVCRTNPTSVVCGICWGVSVVCSIFDLIASWFPGS